jgi:hypothetical protein
MGQQRGQPDLAGILVDGGGLHRGDLVLAKTFANDIKPAGERGIAEGPVTLAWKWRADGGTEGLFRVAEFALGLGQGCGTMAPTVSLERCMVRLHLHRSKLTAPDLERLDLVRGFRPQVL